MRFDYYLDRTNLDFYLTQLGKEYRKLSHVPIQLIVVGGAAIFIKYSFRSMSLDLDAVFSPKHSDALKHAIKIVADKYDLPNGWINDDFIRTSSFSERITIYSEYYRTFSNVIEVRLIDSLHLIAMKLMSFRPYKRDLSDIIGIINEEKKKDHIITKDQIINGFNDLYPNKALSNSATRFLENIFDESINMDVFYKNIKVNETVNKNLLASKIEDNKTIVEKDTEELVDLIMKRMNK